MMSNLSGRGLAHNEGAIHDSPSIELVCWLQFSQTHRQLVIGDCGGWSVSRPGVKIGWDGKGVPTLKIIDEAGGSESASVRTLAKV